MYPNNSHLRKDSFFSEINNKIKNRKIDTKVLDLPKGNAIGFVHPDVIYFPKGYDNYRFWMFYTPYPPDEEELPFLLRSNDLNTFSSKGVSNPLFKTGIGDSWDNHHLADLDVVYTQKKWYMYFSGAKFVNNQKFSNIGLAFSKNGKSWKKYSNNPLFDPSSIKGIKTNSNALKTITTPSVIVYRKKFYMVISLDIMNGLFLAISKDGIHFEFIDDNPIIDISENWEKLGINHPKLFFFNDKFYLYYVGRNNMEEYQLGFAQANSDDISTWKKSKLNPILSAKRDLKEKIAFTILNTLGRTHLPGEFTLKKSFSMIPMPWDSFYIYRSCPIVSGEGELEIVDGAYYLFVSAYDLIGPKIGIMKVELDR